MVRNSKKDRGQGRGSFALHSEESDNAIRVLRCLLPHLHSDNAYGDCYFIFRVFRAYNSTRAYEPGEEEQDQLWSERAGRLKVDNAKW